MSLPKIGLIALGQSEASDELEAVSQGIGVATQIIRSGALDGLGVGDIAALAPEKDEKPIVCKTIASGETHISFAKVFPHMQNAVARVDAQEVELIAILCGADWSEIVSRALLVNMGAIMPQLISSLARGKKLGILLPIAEQVQPAEAMFARLGINAVGTYASLCGGTRMHVELTRAATFFTKAKVDLVWMPCMGMNKAMQQLIYQRVHLPVLLANSLLAKIISEMIC